MTFHQYKIVKRLTRIVALLSISALFMNTVALFAVRSIKADTNCDGTVSIQPIDSIISEIEPGESYSFHASDGRGMVPGADGSGSYKYLYWLYAKDLTTGKEHIKGQGSFEGFKDLSISFSDEGDKEIWITYRRDFTNNSNEGSGIPGLDGPDYDGGTSDGIPGVTDSACDNKNTNKLSIKVINRQANSPYLTLEASQYKALKGDTVTIKSTITSMVGGAAMLTVDDTEPPKWKVDNIATSPLSRDFAWNTSGTSIGMHVIKLKVFGPLNSDGETRPMTDMKVININLCEAGTDINKCADGGSDGSTGGSDDGGGTNVSVPEETEVEIGGSILKFNLTRGSGIGGLVRFIILLLLTLIGAFAFFSFMVAGIQYITAGGDSGKTDKAKKTMIQAAIAIFLATFSFAIFTLVDSIF